MLHQKTMVVDGVWSTVGTTNFDSRSFAHNEENNVCVCDSDLAKKLEAIFVEDKGLRSDNARKVAGQVVAGNTLQGIASLLQEQV